MVVRKDGSHTAKRRRLSEDSSSPSFSDSEDERSTASSAVSEAANGTDEAVDPSSDGVVDQLADNDAGEPPDLPTIAQAKSPAALASRTSFATLEVAPWLVASLSAMQIKRPTSIQAGCIPEILKGRDCIGGSKTGSGKTVAFAVPILQTWAEDPKGIFAVILTPTRELALQIYEQFVALGAPHSLKATLITGGGDLLTQATSLARRPHVVIATPGRLADHIRTSGADTVAGLKRARFVVLDEADRLLAPGYGSMLPDVEECMGALPPASERQTCLFTATVTDEVRALKERKPAKGQQSVFVCEIDTEALATPQALKQTYLLAPVTQRECYLHILLLTPANASRSTIIFVNRTATAEMLEHMLRLLDHRVTALHSGMPQRERTANLARFRARAARILVATDVAARGLDIPAVELVINFDVPRNPDDYVHRVGRTARAGKKGTSITMIGQRDVELVLAIEDRVGTKMEVYDEGESVNIETRVVRDALKPVGEAKREALLQIEQGMNHKGVRKRQKLKALKT